MSVDIAVKDNVLKCKVVNSKNEFVPFHDNGVGINNVKKRLEFLYREKYDLKLADEGEFFSVGLVLELNVNKTIPVISIKTHKEPARTTMYEDSLLVNR
jgi:hypothetical protein